MGANIPLPALGLHPAEQPDIGASVGRMMQLKGMMQQQQSQGIALQQQQQALKDQQAMTAAFKKWDGKDPASLIKGITDEGGSGQAAIGAQTHILQMQKVYSEKAKDDAETGQKNLEIAKGHADAISGALNGLKQVPDEQLVPQATQVVSDLVKNGHLDPQKAQQATQILQSGDPTKIRTALDTFTKINTFQSQQMDAAAKQAEADLKNAEKRKIDAELDGGNPADPHFQQRKYQNILRALQTGQPVPAQDAAWAKSYELSERKTTTSSDSLGVTSSNTSGPSGLSAVRGNGGGGAGGGAGAQGLKDSMVDMVGQYKLNPTMLQRMMVKHPEVIAAVQQKYPDWDQTTYNAKNKILLDYTSGPESKTINAINTALGHAGELNEAIKALNNGDIGLKTLRSIGNRLGVEVGGDSVTTFNTIVHRLAPEISAAYVQGGGTGGERSVDAKDFDAALGDKQLTSNLATTVKLLRSKISAQENQWNNTFRPTKDADKFENRFITPQAKSTMDSLTSKPPAGGGGHVIKIGDKQYQYKGSGNTADLANYTEVK